LTVSLTATGDLGVAVGAIVLVGVGDGVLVGVDVGVFVSVGVGDKVGAGDKEGVGEGEAGTILGNGVGVRFATAGRVGAGERPLGSKIFPQPLRATVMKSIRNTEINERFMIR